MFIFLYKMDVKSCAFLFLVSFGSASCSVIIPEELPSLLSVAYSNIPPIKKGTDSRVGFGFAFGNHADFQVLLELGPQTNTMNLSYTKKNCRGVPAVECCLSSLTRGCSMNLLRDTSGRWAAASFRVLTSRTALANPPAKRAGQPFGSQAGSNAKRQAPFPQQKINKNREKVLSTDGGKFLQNWAQKMRYPKPVVKAPPPRPGDVPNLEDSVVELVKNPKGEYEIHQPNPGMPSSILDDLRRLYGQKKEEAKKITEKKRSEIEVEKITADLSNVDLD